MQDAALYTYQRTLDIRVAAVEVDDPKHKPLNTIEWLTHNTVLDALATVKFKDLFKKYSKDFDTYDWVPLGPKIFSRTIRKEYQALREHRL